MEKITSKLTVAFVVLLLVAAMMTTAIAQRQTAIDFTDLAAKGEAIATADPRAAELRNQVPEGPARRGFDIGMAVAQGHTLRGPGKDSTRNLLPRDEQGGFTTAVDFSVDRNRNAVRAAKGADIANVDPIVAAARRGKRNGLYWLGFDIATGMFGDPALGAEGKTATGPGSLGTRDALSPAGQEGFNASMELHLKKYQRTSGNAVVTPAGKFGAGAVVDKELARNAADVKSVFLNSPVIKADQDLEAANLRGAAVILANLPFISDVKVRPDTRDVIISFASTQKAPPLIEIGKVAPAPDQKGVLAFPAGSGAFSRFVPGQNGTYSLNLGTLGEQLDIGRRYYYIINVFNDNRNNTSRPREQVTGKFTTLPQTVKVIFTEIYIFPLPFERNYPDYVFRFHVKLPEDDDGGWNPPYGLRELGTPDKPLKLVWGANPIQLEILIKSAPDILSIEVGGAVPNLVIPRPDSKQSPSTREADRYSNGAEGNYDLSNHPGDSVSIPFSWTSGPPRRLIDGQIIRGLLAFQIKGRIEVTR